MSKLKLLFLFEYYPPYIRGGAEISGSLLASELSKHYAVTVLTPNYDHFQTEKVRHHRMKLIKYRSLRYFFVSISAWHQTHSQKNEKKPSKRFYFKLMLFNLFARFEMKREIKKLLKKTKFSIIHANNYESALALLAVKTTAKKVIHLRDFSFICLQKWWVSEPQNWIFQVFLNWQKKMLKNSDVSYIAISQYVKFVFSNWIPSDRIFVIYNPIKHSVYSVDDKAKIKKTLLDNLDQKVVLFVGNLMDYKGTQVVYSIAQKLFFLSFYLCGGPVPPEKEQLGLPKNLVFNGSLNSAQLSLWYQAADILIVPSLWPEPFGRVVIEAHQYHLPTIVFNRGALPELVQESLNGWIVEDEAEMEQKLSDFFMTKKRFEFSFEKMEQFSSETIGRKTREFYERILENKI